jgi:hypothetical protein
MAKESHSTKRELLDDLRTARDTVRVQAHLFSLDAKERWQELEGKLLNAEAKLEHAGDSVGENISKTVEELVRAVKEALEELTKPSTPERKPGN